MGTFAVVSAHYLALSIQAHASLALCIIVARGCQAGASLVWGRIGDESRWAGADGLPVDDVALGIGSTGSVARRGASAIDADAVQRAVIIPAGTHALGVAAGCVRIADHSDGAGALVVPSDG